MPDHSQNIVGSLPNIQKYSSTNASPSTHSYELVINNAYDPNPPWSKPSLQRKHSLRLSNPQKDSTQSPNELSETTETQNQQEVRPVTINNREKGATSLGERLELTSNSTPLVTDADGFIEDDCRLYQRAADQDNDDVCSSLCLNDNEVAEDANEYPAGVNYQGHQLVYQNGEPELQYQGLHSRYFKSNFDQVEATLMQESADSKDLIPLAIQRKDSLSPSRPGETSWRLHHQHQKIRSPSTQSESIPKRGAAIQGERRHKDNVDSDCLEVCEVGDSSIFDYCQTSEIESDTETVRKSADEGDGESAHWTAEVEEEQAEEKHVPQPHRAALSMPGGARGAEVRETMETGENQSITGDSGIDSPRTRVSLASSNTVILEGLKRRGFLQNLEKLHSKSSAIRPQSSLLQLTPVMNV